LFAPVVAAREKHEAVAGRPVRTQTEAGIEVSAEA
jgi:hypothetical protein